MQFGLNENDWRSMLVGASAPMESVVRIIGLAAPRKSTVLITGETGTGKEVAARAIHAASGRAHRPMVTVNCGAIPSNLIEAELFGHVRGAYTGAIQSRAGRFEEANTGTIFLDEIGELPIDVQAKLLRVLQEREVQRVGSSETIPLDIRVIAATNCNLEEAVARREFRQDLFYRLSVVPLKMPALRQRVQDIRVLAQHFVDAICRSENLLPKRISEEAIPALLSYSWPGNVRQLQHAVEMAVVLSGERTVLFEEDFALPNDPEVRMHNVEPIRLPETGLDFDATVSRFERSILEQALSRCAGNKAKAAEILGMKRTTMLAKLKALNMIGAIEARSACA
jgi:transcriptional regulator with GAF, ATPase, and Fis domain